MDFNLPLCAPRFSSIFDSPPNHSAPFRPLGPCKTILHSPFSIRPSSFVITPFRPKLGFEDESADLSAIASATEETLAREDRHPSSALQPYLSLLPPLFPPPLSPAPCPLLPIPCSLPFPVPPKLPPDDSPPPSLTNAAQAYQIQQGAGTGCI